jgi:hypothetical protein
LDSHWALLKGCRKAAGKSPKTTGSHLAILKVYWKAAGKCPYSCCQPIGDEAELFSGYWLKHGNFHLFSLKQRVSVYIYKKSKEQGKIFKTLSGSSPIFALSIHTTFSQTQIGATIPLMMRIVYEMLGFSTISIRNGKYTRQQLGNKQNKNSAIGKKDKIVQNVEC